MKPTFALDLRDTSVALLHRTARGWMQVGETAFDAPDLADALSFMRSTALGLSPRGLSTKLVIPNSQIRYLKIEAPGPDAAKRRKQIAAGLEGKTPYDVKDLVFDWSGTGPEVMVAVIARETLEEAEAFAAEHRFNPLSFVAIPAEGDFKGEPWFGPTALAPAILREGEKVDRDQDPIVIVARETPKPDPVVAADPPLAPAEPEPAPGPEPEPVPEPAPEIAPQPAPEPEPELPPAPVEVPDPVEEIPASTPVEMPPELEPSGDAAPIEIPGGFPGQMTSVLTGTPAGTPVDDLADEAPMAVDVETAPEPAAPIADGTAQTAHLRVIDNSVADEDLPPLPAEAVRAALANRAGEARPRPTGPTLPGTQRPDVARPSLARPLPGAKGEAKAAKSGSAGKPLRAFGGLVTAPSIPGTKRAKPTLVTATPNPPPTAAQPAAAAPRSQPAPAKPLDGGLGGGRKPLPRGKPRYLGLVLTGILLVFLALVAAWSTFFLASGNGDDALVPVEENLAAAEVADVPAPEDEMLADLQDPAELAADQDAGLALADSEGPGPEDLVEPAAEEVAALEEPVAEPVAEPAPGTAVATETGSTGAVASEVQDEIFLAALDAPPRTTDPLSLPAPEARADALPAPAVPPPPFGTVYQFDADGRIVATPEGIISPEGVLLVAGPPPKVPPQRPAGLTAAAAPAAPAAEPDTATALPADPALQGFRPRGRPEGLTPPPAAQEAEDDASIAPAPTGRLASLRPKAKPAQYAAVEAAPAGAEAASLAAGVTELAAADTTRSPLAVAVSKKPAPRPADLSRAVEAAVAAAVRAPEPEPEPDPAPQGNDEAEADNEPEVDHGQPALPSRASVAKQATFVDAINLSKINLIGVYGTENDRYALIRQANGRYKKVRVGDQIDGGKIAAITASEVRYQKGGRLVTLALPKT